MPHCQPRSVVNKIKVQNNRLFEQTHERLKVTGEGQVVYYEPLIFVIAIV